MRKVEYLSPTSLAKWKENPKEFYMFYLAEASPPRDPQSQPMSIGSAFDAYVKSFLHEKLIGKDPQFELQTIFESQVEPHNRDWALIHGKFAFNEYQRLGALSDLLVELSQSVGSPRFEITVKGAIHGYREGVTLRLESGVTFLGKPDVYYINRYGVHVILDFKVNGWCSKSAVSPKPGYTKLRPGCMPHKNCFPAPWKGAMINTNLYLEDIDQTWATQLAIYGWLCGLEIGDEFIVAVDQLVCKPVGGTYPEVRVAEHRLRIRPDYQWAVYRQAQELWSICQGDHIFRDMSYADSKSQCQMLDAQAVALSRPMSEEDRIFNSMTRG